MDPASVVGLVAACASLAKATAGVVKSLHSLVGIYKSAELSILSITEECSTIELSWRQIERWASVNLYAIDDYELIADQLKRSIYCGELVMTALGNDLSNATASNRKFSRGAKMAWNEKTFAEHQGRIRGQITSLQLLLQVVNLRRKEDRSEMLSVKEHIFKEIEESARSIVPSRLSSRYSVTSSDTASVKTTKSLDIKYIPFSFENDLFTSYVYKRNYRAAMPIFISRRVTVPSAVPSRAPRRFNSFRSTAETSLTLTEGQAAALLSFPDNLNRTRGPRLDTTMSKDFLQKIQSRNSAVTLFHLSNGADIVDLFHPSSMISLDDVIWVLDSVRQLDPSLFEVIVKRIAYWAGNTVACRLLSELPNLDPALQSHQDLLDVILAAGRVFDRSCTIFNNSLQRPTALQLATISGDQAVVSHLLGIGYREESFGTSMLLATLQENSDLVRCLTDAIGRPDDLFTQAIAYQLITNDPDSVLWSTNDGKPIQWSIEHVLYVLLRHGANPASPISYESIMTTPIHTVICAIHENDIPYGAGLFLIEFLIHGGGNPNASSGAVSLPKTHTEEMTPLALACYLDQAETVKVLQRNGATIFWSRSMDVFFHSSSRIQLHTLNTLIDKSTLNFHRMTNGSLRQIRHLKERFESRIGAGNIVNHRGVQPSPQELEDYRIRASTDSLGPWLNSQAADSPLIGQIVVPNHLHLPNLKNEPTIAAHHAEHQYCECSRLVRLAHYDLAIKFLYQGLDIALVVKLQDTIPLPDFVKFMLYIWANDQSFCRILIRRIAFAAGNEWVTELKRCILELYWRLNDATSFITIPLHTVWYRAHIAANFMSALYNAGHDVVFWRSVDLACAADDYEVTKYLLNAGHMFYGGPESAVCVATTNLSASMLELLGSSCLILQPTYTSALILVFVVMMNPSEKKAPILLLDPSWDPTAEATFEVVELLLKSGAKAQVPLTNHENGPTPLFAAISNSALGTDRIINLLLRHSASTEHLAGPAEDPQVSFRASPLALAALYGRTEIFGLLRRQGATIFTIRNMDFACDRILPSWINADSGFIPVHRIRSLTELLWSYAEELDCRKLESIDTYHAWYTLTELIKNIDRRCPGICNIRPISSTGLDNMPKRHSL